VPKKVTEDYTLSAYKWSKMLAKNEKLLHLDISFNGFKAPDMEIIGEGLKENRTLLGLHVIGNEGNVDSLGFVHASKEGDMALCHIYTRIPVQLKQVRARDFSLANNCWICEGWSPIEFRVKDDTAVPSLHLSFEDFKPHLMAPDILFPKGNIFFMHRMVPPGSLKYFYSNGQKSFINQSVVSVP